MHSDLPTMTPKQSYTPVKDDNSISPLSSDTRSDSIVAINATSYLSQLSRKIFIFVTTGLAASKSFVPIEEIFANDIVKPEKL